MHVSYLYYCHLQWDSSRCYCAPQGTDSPSHRLADHLTAWLHLASAHCYLLVLRTAGIVAALASSAATEASEASRSESSATRRFAPWEKATTPSYLCVCVVWVWVGECGLVGG